MKPIIITVETPEGPREIRFDHATVNAVSRSSSRIMSIINRLRKMDRDFSDEENRDTGPVSSDASSAGLSRLGPRSGHCG